RALRRDPPLERRGRIHDDAHAHVGVRGAAELDALAPVLAGRLGRERESVQAAGYHVALAPELRDPEAVDHVGALERELDGPAGGQVELVRRRDVERRVPELPPPLAAT